MPVSETTRLEHRLTARPESITALRRAVVAYAARRGATSRRREDIALAVSEAVSNVVIHAYEGRDIPGDVRVDAWIDAAGLQVTVCDDGGGMDRGPSASPGLGVGLALMGRVSDRLRFERTAAAGGVCVCMTFALS